MVFTLVIGFVPDSGFFSPYWAIPVLKWHDPPTHGKIWEHLLLNWWENQWENHLQVVSLGKSSPTDGGISSVAIFFLVSGRTFASQRPGGTQVGTSRPGAVRLFWDDLGGQDSGDPQVTMVVSIMVESGMIWRYQMALLENFAWQTSKIQWPTEPGFPMDHLEVQKIHPQMNI